MKCECGGDLEVKDSRPAPQNTVRRVRRCLKCDKRFATYEYRDKYPSSKSENRSPLVRADMQNVSLKCYV